MELCWEQGFRSVEVQSRQGRESITGWQTCLPLLAGHAGLVSAKKLFLTGAESFFFSVRSKHEPASPRCCEMSGSVVDGIAVTKVRKIVCEK